MYILSRIIDVFLNMLFGHTNSTCKQK